MLKATSLVWLSSCHEFGNERVIFLKRSALLTKMWNSNRSKLLSQSNLWFWKLYIWRHLYNKESHIYGIGNYLVQYPYSNVSQFWTTNEHRTLKFTQIRKPLHCEQKFDLNSAWRGFLINANWSTLPETTELTNMNI